MIGHPIAFYAAKKATRGCVVEYSKIDSISGYANLRHHCDVASSQFVQHVSLERRVGLRGSIRSCAIEPTMLRIQKKFPQQTRAVRSCRREVDFVALHRRENPHALTRPGGYYVQAPPAIF